MHRSLITWLLSNPKITYSNWEPDRSRLFINKSKQSTKLYTLIHYSDLVTTALFQGDVTGAAHVTWH